MKKNSYGVSQRRFFANNEGFNPRYPSDVLDCPPYTTHLINSLFTFNIYHYTILIYKHLFNRDIILA